MIDDFHFVGRIVHAGDGGHQVEAEFVADGGGNFDERIFFDDEAGVAGARVGLDHAGESGDQIDRRS